MKNSIIFNKLKQNKGLSLVELLVVVLLVLALTLIVANGYRSIARRNIVQSEAINIATRLEQLRSAAITQKRVVISATDPSSRGTQYRIRFNPIINGVNCNCLVAEYYDTSLTTPAWVAAPEVSSVAIPLSNRVRFGVDSLTPTVTTIPVDQPPCSPSKPVQAGQACNSNIQEGEIRFNSQGFPVATNSVAPPSAPRAANAIYINDGRSSYAITLNILGRIQVWSYDRGFSNQWIPISGSGR
ncbi:MAG: hypothetical protein J0M03_12150 [Acidobacteria bacterium]|nr:hypothetical protein [Acidobacteriota bacterium]